MRSKDTEPVAQVVRTDGLSRIYTYLTGVKDGRGGTLEPIGTHALDELLHVMHAIHGNIGYALPKHASIEDGYTVVSNGDLERLRRSENDLIDCVEWVLRMFVEGKFSVGAGRMLKINMSNGKVYTVQELVEAYVRNSREELGELLYKLEYPLSSAQATDCRKKILDEHDRLTAEVERLKADNAELAELKLQALIAQRAAEEVIGYLKQEQVCHDCPIEKL